MENGAEKNPRAWSVLAKANTPRRELEAVARASVSSLLADLD